MPDPYEELYGITQHEQRQIDDLYRHLHILEEKVQEIMTAQDDVNAAVTAIQAVTTDLTNAVTNIQAEIAALKAANVAVDTSALDTAVTQLQAVQATVDALETPPAS